MTHGSRGYNREHLLCLLVWITALDCEGTGVVWCWSKSVSIQSGQLIRESPLWCRGLEGWWRLMKAGQQYIQVMWGLWMWTSPQTTTQDFSRKQLQTNRTTDQGSQRTAVATLASPACPTHSQVMTNSKLICECFDSPWLLAENTSPHGFFCCYVTLRVFRTLFEIC